MLQPTDVFCNVIGGWEILFGKQSMLMKPKESAKRHQTISWVILPVTMYGQMESVYVQKFQRLINGTLSSGEFSKSFAKKMEDVGAHSASGFID